MLKILKVQPCQSSGTCFSNPTASLAKSSILPQAVTAAQTEVYSIPALQYSLYTSSYYRGAQGILFSALALGSLKY